MKRTDAIKAVGLKAVEKVESKNCEPTSRLLPDHADYQEWESSVLCKSLETGEEVVLSAMYYPRNEDFHAKKYFPNADADEMLEDLSYVDWKIDHYRIDGQA